MIDSKHLPSMPQTIDQKNQQFEMQRQKEEFETIFRISRDGLAILDLQTNFLEFNDAYLEMTGFTREELLKKSCLELSIPEDHERAVEALKTVLEQGRLDHFEKQCRIKNGKIIMISMSLALLPDKKRILISTKNITEQNGIYEEVKRSNQMLLQKSYELEKANQEVNRQKDEFETIFKTAKDGIAILDLQSNFLNFNDTYLEMTGYTREELLTKSSIGISAPEDKEHSQKAIETAIQEGYVRNVEKTYIAKGGNRVMINMAIALMPDKKRILISAKDVTDQNAVTEQIKLGALKLEIAAKSADIGIWTWDFASNTLDWNEQMYTIYGIESASSISPYETWIKALHPDDSRRAESEVQHAAEFEGKFDTVFRIIKHSTHEIRYIKASGVCQFDKSDKKVAMIGTNIDITEQKLYEEKLNSAIKEIEEANHAKSEFLANMSHEIRTPLNGIIGLNTLMLTTNLTSTQKEYITKAQQSSKALMNVINDILDYSKIEAGKLDFENRMFSIEEVLRSSSDLFEYSIAQKSLEFHIDIDPNIPLQLEGDPLRLGQIFNNLIGNAVKFTERGDIIVRVKSLIKNDENILIECSIGDSGIGISEEEQLRLFSAFSQSDASNTRKYGGTGLGLVISKQLSELMGGEIWLESTKGVGSIFYFTVKLRLPPEAHGRLSIPALDQSRFLIADDNELERELIASIVRSWGASAIVCESGENAIELMMTERFDYLVVDWQMPGLDGLDVIKNIQQMSHQNFPKIIMVTAYSKEELHKVAAQKEVVLERVLYKPVTPSVLLESIGDKGITLKNEGIKPPSARFKGRVLVVEDNEINQLVIRDLLELLGLEVDIAQNGEIGVQCVKENPYDLVLMDLQMPVMDGLGAARRIREFNTTVPIIALSAAVMEKDKQSTLQSGMNAHLSKPIDHGALMEILERYLVRGTGNNDLIVRQPSAEAVEEWDLHSFSQMFQPDQIERFVRKFAEKYRDIGRQLKGNILGDEELNQMIHTLKGVSGTLGFKRVYELSVMVDDCDDSQSQTVLLESLSEALNRAIYLIDERFPPEQKVILQRDVSLEEIRTTIESMIRRLEERAFVDDTEVERCLSCILTYADPEMIDNIRNSMDAFDYEKAAELFKTLYEGIHA